MNALLAYFDPGAGSLLLQALVGGVSGLVVVARYAWLSLLTRGQSSKSDDSTLLTTSTAQ